MEDEADERLEVARIFDDQSMEIQEIIKSVLSIERSRLHLRRTPKPTVEKLVDAVREIIK